MTSWFRIIGLLAFAMLLTISGANSQDRLGVPPQDAWSCPPSHPIKGNLTTYSDEPCIYHMPGARYDQRTKPERCYATEEEARKDGCCRSTR